MAVPARASQKSVRDAAGRAESSASPARGRGAWRRRQRRRSSSASATSWGGNGMRASAACAGAQGSYCAKGVVAAAIKNVCLECARSVRFSRQRRRATCLARSVDRKNAEITLQVPRGLLQLESSMTPDNKQVQWGYQDHDAALGRERGIVICQPPPRPRQSRGFQA